MATIKFGQKVSLRTYFNKYLSAQSNGDLTAAPANPRSYEMFILVNPAAPNDASEIQFGDKVALLGHHNQYMVAENDGRANANRPDLGDWEQFTLVKPAEHTNPPPVTSGFMGIQVPTPSSSTDLIQSTDGVALQTHHNTYLNGDDNGVCKADARAVGPWEQFFFSLHQDEDHSPNIQIINDTSETLQLPSSFMSVGPNQQMEVKTSDIGHISTSLGTVAPYPRIPFDTLRLRYQDEPNNAPKTVVYEYSQANRLLKSIPTIPADNSRRVRFLASADPQFFKDTPARNDVAKQVMLRMWARVYQNMDEYFGLLMAGDLTQMAIKTEWETYHKIASTMEVYDSWGNHDIENDWAAGLAEHVDRDDEIRKHILHTHRRFPCNRSSDDNKAHYSWDWRDVHFVNVNLYPGNSADASLIDPQDSLAFLEDDLKDHVGNSGRPVVIMQHYGFDDFSTQKEIDDDKNWVDLWWTDTERAIFWDAIADYNVILIISGHGHNHKSGYVEWNKPIGATNSTKYPREGRQIIHNLIAGGACLGYYMDIEILSDKIKVIRYEDMGNTQTSTSLSLI